MLQCVGVCTYSSEVLQGDIIQIQQRGFHSGRHISEGWDLDLGAKYHILTRLNIQDLVELYSTKQDTDALSLFLHIYGCLEITIKLQYSTYSISVL